MEDIKILEEFIEQYNASYPEEKEWVAIYPNQVQAIENLIVRNKELESALDNSVSKDVIEEKIEELETVTNSGGYLFIKKRNSSIQIEVLQELLNKGE